MYHGHLVDVTIIKVSLQQAVYLNCQTLHYYGDMPLGLGGQSSVLFRFNTLYLGFKYRFFYIIARMAALMELVPVMRDCLALATNVCKCTLLKRQLELSTVRLFASLPC